METALSRLSWNRAKLDSRFRPVILVCLVATLSYLAAQLGFTLMVPPLNVSPLWPVNALLVSVLLLVPRKLWPVLIAAALGAVIVADVQKGMPISVIAWLVLGNLVEILIATWVIGHLLNGVPELNSVKGLAKYLFLVVILAPFAAAFFGANAGARGYWLQWRLWFFSGSLALLVVLSASVTLLSKVREQARKSRDYYLEAAALIAGLVVFGYFTFVASGRSSPPVLLYSLLPFLVWSALRFGSSGVSTSMIVVAFLSTWGAAHGRGPFTELGKLNNVLSLQLFLFFTAPPFMVLAALVEERKQAEGAIRESEERYRRIVETANEGIWLVDSKHHTLFVNQHMAEMLGYEPEEMLGRSAFDFHFPEDLNRTRQALERRRSGVSEHYDSRFRRQDGSELWVQMAATPIIKENGEFDGSLAMMNDISERRRAEAALQESEARLRMAIQAGRMYAFEWDPTTDVIVRTGQCADILNWMDDPTRDTGRRFVAKVHPDDREAYASPQTGLTPEDPTYQTSYRVLRPDGSVIWLEANGRAFFDGQGRRLRIIGLVADVTERKLAEEALSRVSRKLIEAQEQERARIARELHDDLSQRMALLQIGIEQFEQDTAGLSSQARQQLHNIAEVAADVSCNIHNLSHQLHPFKLDTLGLVASLEGLCRELSNQHNLQVQFVHHDIPGQIPKDATLCLFRIVQEALRNVVRHSGAAEAKVELSGHDDRIDLCISDSGVGFSPESAKGNTGLGLISMRERLRLVGGQLSVESEPSHGTRIQVRVSLFTTKAEAESEGRTRKAGA
jgi:PAS domain S-box-containing protein